MPNTFEKIKLTRGKFAIVDAELFPFLNRFKWHAGPSRGAWYAKRAAGPNGAQVKIWMHKLILGISDDQEADHINGDSLDNRLSNLRLCTRRQNCFNRGPRARTASGLKGVSTRCRPTAKKPWRAQIKAGDIVRSLGDYATAEEAARAYDAAAIELHGEFARLNFPLKEGA